MSNINNNARIYNVDQLIHLGYIPTEHKDAKLLDFCFDEKIFMYLNEELLIVENFHGVEIANLELI